MFSGYVKLKVKIKELEFEQEKMQEKMDFTEKKLRQDLDLQKQTMEHNFNLKVTESKQEVTLEKKKNAEEVANLKAQLVLKHSQEVEELKLVHGKKVNALELKAQQEIVDEKEKLNAEFYKKITTELSTIHSKGNHTTDFLKEMTLKMMDKDRLQIDNNSTQPAVQVTPIKVD